MDPNATPSEGASDPVDVPIDNGPRSIDERLDAFLSAEQSPQKASSDAAPKSTSGEAEPAESTEDPAEPIDGEKAADADSAPEEKPKTLRELSDKLGMTYEELLDGIQAETKVDGEEGTATLSKLIKSHQLEGHLNRKSMELSDARKAFEVETQQKKQQFDAQLSQLSTSLDANIKMFHGELARVNWQELEANDPVEYLRLRASFEDRNRKLIEHHQFLNAEEGKRKQAAEEAQKAKFATEIKLLVNAVPEWKTEAALEKGHAEIMKYLKSSGLGDDEISAIQSHKHILILRDAMKYRELQERKPAVVKKISEAPKFSRPGSVSKGDTESASYVKSREQLRKTGKLSLDLLSQFIK